MANGNGIPTDQSSEQAPGKRYAERDWQGGQMPGQRGFDANFPYPLKGDRGEASLTPRQPVDGGTPFANIRSGR